MLSWWIPWLAPYSPVGKNEWTVYKRVKQRPLLSLLFVKDNRLKKSGVDSIFFWLLFNHFKITFFLFQLENFPPRKCGNERWKQKGRIRKAKTFPLVASWLRLLRFHFLPKKLEGKEEVEINRPQFFLSRFHGQGPRRCRCFFYSFPRGWKEEELLFLLSSTCWMLNPTFFPSFSFPFVCLPFLTFFLL